MKEFLTITEEDFTNHTHKHTMKLSKADKLWNESELERLKPSPYNYRFTMTDGNDNKTLTIQINEETFQKIKRILTK